MKIDKVESDCVVSSSECKLIFPSESYKILGAVFEVYKVLGSKLREEFYQKAFASLRLARLRETSSPRF